MLPISLLLNSFNKKDASALDAVINSLIAFIAGEFPEYTVTLPKTGINISRAFWASGDAFDFLFKLANTLALGVDVLLAAPRKFNPFTAEIAGSTNSEIVSQKPSNCFLAAIASSELSFLKNPLPYAFIPSLK